MGAKLPPPRNRDALNNPSLVGLNFCNKNRPQIEKHLLTISTWIVLENSLEICGTYILRATWKKGICLKKVMKSYIHWLEWHWGPGKIFKEPKLYPQPIWFVSDTCS